MSSEASDSDKDIPKVTRKRQVHREKWKNVVNKKKRDSGEEYFSVRLRKIVSGRSVKGPCKCSGKCFH